MQLAVVVLETLGLLFIDKYFHKIPVGQVWRSMTGRTMAFLCVALSVGMLSEVTKLFLYFCPKYYDEVRDAQAASCHMQWKSLRNMISSPAA